MNSPWNAFVKWRDEPPETDAPPSPQTGLRRFFSLALRRFWSLVGLNLLGLVLCLPVVTIPATLSALARVCMELVQRDTLLYPFGTFWKEWKEDFVSRILCGLPLLLLPVILGIGANAIFGAAAGAGLLLLCAFALIPVQCYFYPLTATVALPLRMNLKNALLLPGASGLRRVLALIVLVGLPFGLVWLLFPFSLFGAALFLLSFPMLAVSMVTAPVINQWITPAQED